MLVSCWPSNHFPNKLTLSFPLTKADLTHMLFLPPAGDFTSPAGTQSYRKMQSPIPCLPLWGPQTWPHPPLSLASWGWGRGVFRSPRRLPLSVGPTLHLSALTEPGCGEAKKPDHTLSGVLGGRAQVMRLHTPTLLSQFTCRSWQRCPTRAISHCSPESSHFVFIQKLF